MEARLTEQREKRRRRKVVVEVLVFWLFFTVLMMTSYMERSPLAYHMTQHEQNVILDGGDVTEVKDISSFWTWFTLSFLPAKQKETLKFSYPIGQVQLRQVRLQPDSHCEIPYQMKAVMSRCTSAYSNGESDKRNFSHGWIFNDSTRGENEECNKNLVPPNVTGSFEYNDCATEQVHLQDMWKYTSTTSFASGIPYVGEHGTYRGGGYIASLGTTERSRFNITSYLRQHNWLDDQTRAVFVELVLYNPHVNLFSVLSLAVEFTNLGAAYASYEVITVRLIQHDAVLLLLLRGCLVLFLLYFAFTEGKKVFFRPLEYVNDAWNWLELVTIAVGFCTLCMYFYSQDIIDELLEQRAAGNDAFIMYKDAVDWFQHKQEANPEDVGFVAFLKQTTSSAGSKVKTAASKVRRRKLQAQKDTPSDILDAVGHVLERLDKHSASYDSTL
ncbi:polycystin-1-like protein 2 [Branchiostoma floridae x Branchiostoma belcheri]